MLRRRTSPASAMVHCAGGNHVIRSDGRTLVLADHPGHRDADNVLVALSGERAKCREIEDAWHALQHEVAVELVDATPERLRWIAARLPVVRDQRGRTARRDDVTPDERERMIAGFDQMAYLALVASLGPPLANVRGTIAARALRRGFRRLAS